MSPDGLTLVVSERTPSADRMALVLWDVDGTNPRRVYQDDAYRSGRPAGTYAGLAARGPVEAGVSLVHLIVLRPRAAQNASVVRYAATSGRDRYRMKTAAGTTNMFSAVDENSPQTMTSASGA